MFEAFKSGLSPRTPYRETLLKQRMEFRDVVVHPTQELLAKPAGSLVRAGPLWPHWRFQRDARHCRSFWGRPVDDPPHPAPPTANLDAGIWCGPATGHFGHMIADFGMRIPASAALDRDLPLIFSTAPKRKPAEHFWSMLDHLGAQRSRVLLVGEPILCRRLFVHPQAERLHGVAPGEAHLCLMDELAPVDPAKDLDLVYVSRSRRPSGNLAGEGCLDAAFTGAGARVFYPEEVPLSEQLRTYGRAKLLVFAEGSAVHALQLLGRGIGRVVVIARRSGERIAKSALEARCREVHYVDAVDRMLHGLGPTGYPSTSRGIAIMDDKRLLSELAAVGVNLRPSWSTESYQAIQRSDLQKWLDLRLAQIRHKDEIEFLASQIVRLPRKLCPENLAF